jgi:hypothetical protein
MCVSELLASVGAQVLAPLGASDDRHMCERDVDHRAPSPSSTTLTVLNKINRSSDSVLFLT